MGIRATGIVKENDAISEEEINLLQNQRKKETKDKVIGKVKNLFQWQEQSQIYAQETSETVNTNENIEAIKLTLHSDTFGIFKGIFDSGSSLNCIDMHHAYKYYRNKIQNINDFYVRTANGNIIIKQFIKMKMKRDGREFYTKWYILKNSPYKFIISRALFIRLEYTILDPEGKHFVNKARCQKLQEDLYGAIIKQNDYPTAKGNKREQEILNYVVEIRLFKGNQAANATKLLVLYDICALKIPEEIKEENAEEDQHREGKDIHSILTEICGKITDANIKTQISKLIKENIASCAKNASDIGTIPNEKFTINYKKEHNLFVPNHTHIVMNTVIKYQHKSRIC